jgi:hypothetical protein
LNLLAAPTGWIALMKNRRLNWLPFSQNFADEEIQ